MTIQMNEVLTGEKRTRNATEKERNFARRQRRKIEKRAQERRLPGGMQNSED